MDANFASLYRKKYLISFTLVSIVKNVMFGRRNAVSDNFRQPETIHCI